MSRQDLIAEAEKHGLSIVGNVVLTDEKYYNAPMHVVAELVRQGFKFK